MEYQFLLRSCAVSALVNAAHPGSRPARSAVVFKLDHLGDLLTAVPALFALRRTRPDARITLVVGRWCAEFAREFLPVDEVAVYDSPTFDRDAERRGGGDVASLRSALPASFDVAFGLRDDPATLTFSLRGGCRHRRDRGTVRLADRARRAARTLAGGADPGPLSERATNLRIVDASERDVPDGPLIRPRPEDTARVRSDIEAITGGAASPLVVIHPGAAWEHKRWPAERHAALARNLTRDLGATVFVTGSRDERELAEQLMIDGVRGRSVAGEYDLALMVALLGAADAYIGADTGITHLAALTGTPVVVLFGPGDPRRFGPPGADDVVVYHRQDCSPCPQTLCDRDGVCMRAITVSEVETAVHRVLTTPSHATTAQESGS